MSAVGVVTLNAFFRKNQRINAKSERSKCCGLAISRRRQIYAMIGVELRTLGRFSSNLEDTFAYGSYSSKDVLESLHACPPTSPLHLWHGRDEMPRIVPMSDHGRSHPHIV